MIKLATFLPLLLAALLAGSARAQCDTVTTMTTAGTGQAGTMFDIVNISAGPIVITGFDQCFLNSGTDNIRIYTKSGTWNGSQSNAAAWSFLGSVTGLAHGIAPTLVTIPITLNLTIPAGATQGFYITGDLGGTVAYTAGVGQLGAVIGSDAFLQVRAGVGVSFPFGVLGIFGLPNDGRLWNGRVHYCRQCAAVTTLTTAGTGQAGTMFDVVNTAASPINISSFDQCFLNPGSSTMIVYTKVGTWNGFETNPSAWTLVGVAYGMVHGVAPVLDSIPIDINVTIPQGATQAFYVTSDVAGTVAYTPGVGQLGTVIGSDPDLQVRAGVGVGYWFGGSGIFGSPTDGRLWNGRMHYCEGNGPVLATNTVTGLGCIRHFASIYEQLPPPAFDLGNTTLRWQRTSVGYDVVDSPAGTFVQPGPGAQVVAGGAPFGEQMFSLSSPMPVDGGSTSTLNVCTKGYVATAAGNGVSPFASGSQLLAFPQSTWACWQNYDQSLPGSGQITFEEVSGIAYVTFDGVFTLGSPQPNTFQFQFELATGNVALVMQSIGGAGGPPIVVGYSPGGPNLDPGSTDISASLAAGPIVLSAPEQVPLTLAANNGARLNNDWSLTTSVIPANAVFGIDLFGLSDPGILDLAFLGMPSCQLRTTLDRIDGPWLIGGPTHDFAFALPNNAAILGVHLHSQSMVFQLPPVNNFGAITSNGIDGKVGNF